MKSVQCVWSCNEKSVNVVIRRLIEVLTGSWSLSSELRVPSISRLQKIHNVSLVFNELARRGVIPEWKGVWFNLLVVTAAVV